VNPALPIGAAASLAAAYWYLNAPGRSLSTGLADLESLLTGSLKLTAMQQAMADTIQDVFESEGLGWLVPAAIANAYAESRLDPLAVGDGGASVGLFQLHVNGGGKGMSVEQRMDPVLNAKRIIEEARATPVVKSKGKTHAELAADFARYVERCAECGVKPGDSTAQLTYRADLCRRLFGALADQAS
jgi:hypothetical protein